MYKVTTVFERPNDSVPYYFALHPDVRKKFGDFTSTEPELLLMNVIDESPTKQVTEAFYADEASFNSFMAKFNQQFPNFFNDRDTYHNSVGIITTRTAGEL